MEIIKATETTEMIKNDLSRAFPGIKFYVARGTGSFIAVDWVRGPMPNDVYRIIHKYEEKGGHIICQSHRRTLKRFAK